MGQVVDGSVLARGCGELPCWCSPSLEVTMNHGEDASQGGVGTLAASSGSEGSRGWFRRMFMSRKEV